jgi:hypothetical protein
MAASENSIIWSARPSHWLNSNVYTFCGGIFLLGVLWERQIHAFLHQSLGLDSYFLVYKALMTLPIVIGVWRALQLHFHTYELTPEVLRERVGVFNQQCHELELYRVRDTTVLKPFNLHICGLGNIVLDTSDYSTPVACLLAIKDPDKVRQLIRERVEAMRMKRGVIQVS